MVQAMVKAKGNVVLLNGTSSAGKSRIATALQEQMNAPYLHTGVDHLLPRLPARLFCVTQVGDAATAATSDYFLMVYQGGQGGATRTGAEREGGERVYGDGTLVEVRLGPGAVALLGGCTARSPRWRTRASA